MTAHDTLLSLLGQWVTVTHPGDERRTWHGQLAGMMDSPAIVLAMPEGGTEVLPQSFIVEAAAPAADGPHPDPDSDTRSFAQLRDSGLLWLINRLALHPRGLALALHLDEHGQAYGWSLIRSAEGEPWHFDVATDNDGYQRAEKTIAAALADLPAHAPAPGQSPPCVRCAGPGLYETQDGRRYCDRCINCTCGQPTCHLNTPPAEAPAHTCTATCNDPFHGLARCEHHYPQAGDGFQHEGRSTDGSTLLWNDGEPGATPHRPDTASGHPDTAVPAGGHVRMPDTIGETTPALTMPDTIRTPDPDTGSGRPDTASVPLSRPGLRAALAELADLPPDLLGDARCSCGQDSPLIHVAPDGGHWHMDPAEYERLQRGDLKPDTDTDDRHPAVAAWGACWDRAENYRTRLDRARQVLIEDAYFTPGEIGEDIAPRLIEWMSAHRSRVWELTQLLDELLDRMNIPFSINGRAMVRTDYIDTSTVGEWRRTLDRFRDFDTPLRTTGDCARLDCTLTREDLAQAAGAYDLLRATLTGVSTYTQTQQNAGFPFGGGDNRHRILSRIGTWTHDPGPLKLRTRPEPE